MELSLHVQRAGHGALVGNLSVSDLRGILPEHFSVLAQPVMTFLEMRRAGRCWAGNTPKNPRIQRPTNGCNGWGIKSAEGSQPVHVAACSPESTLLEVIEVGPPPPPPLSQVEDDSALLEISEQVMLN